MALVGLAKWLWQRAVHEVLQLSIDEQVYTTCQQWLEVKHLTLNALHHSYELSKRRLLFWRIVVSRGLHIHMPLVYMMY